MGHHSFGETGWEVMRSSRSVQYSPEQADKEEGTGGQIFQHILSVRGAVVPLFFSQGAGGSKKVRSTYGRLEIYGTGVASRSEWPSFRNLDQSLCNSYYSSLQ